MAAPRSSLRRVIWAPAFVIIILVLLWLALLYFQPIRVKGRQMAKILSSAQSVTIREYRDYLDAKIYQELLTERSLSASQVKQLSPVFTDYYWLADSGKACLFTPHHQVGCRMPDGSAHTIHLCFTCGDIALDNGPPYDMRGWEPKLRELFQSAGVPIREDFYRYNPAK